MAISCTASDLLTASKCLCGIPSGKRELVMIYLLQQLAGLGNLTAAQLLDRAKCLCGLSERDMKAIEVALLCTATGGVPPCPPSGGGAGCTYQDMQVAWTPTNLKLGEILGFTSGNSTPSLSGPTSLIFYQATTNQGFDLEGFHLLTELHFPNLVNITGGGYIFVDDCPLLTNLTLPVFVTTSTDFEVSNTGLASLALPSLTSAPFGIDIINNTSLSSLSLPVWIPTNGQNYNFTGDALGAASVNALLAACVANVGFISGLIDTSGGTSDAPTGQGVIDKGVLNARLPGLAVTN